MRWEYASQAPWLFLLGAFAILILLTERRRRQLVRRLIGGESWRQMIPDLKLSVRYARHFLFVMGLLFLGLAALRPQWGYELREMHRKGLDVLVLVDVSKSMQAKDIKPSRMERVRMKLRDFSLLLKGDRVGLIPFAGIGYVACPLTTDYESFGIFVDQLDTDLISYQGTDIAGALGLAIKSFDPSPDRAKAIILLTDGEATQGDLKGLSDDIKKQGIRVYVIGVGTAEGAPIPEGEGEGFKKDESGEVVISKLDETSLKRLAVETGGVYVNSVSGGLDLDQIYTRGIKREMEQKDIAQGQKRVPEERFEIPLLMGLFFIILASVMREGKRT